MGFDMVTHIYHKNDKTDKYEELIAFNKDGKKLYFDFPTRDSMLNQLLLNYNRGCYDFSPLAYRRGYPQFFLDDMKERYPDYDYVVKDGTYYDYLELNAWVGNPRCFQVDWDEVAELYTDEEDDLEKVKEDPRVKRNPLIEYMRQMDMVLTMFGIYYPKPGEVFVVLEMNY